MTTKRIPATVLGLMLLAAAGCGSGPTLTPVTGTITENGEPLADVAVMFLPQGDDGSLTAEGMTGPDGKYTLTTSSRGAAGVAAGKYKVVVTKLAPPPTGMDPAIAADPYMASLNSGGGVVKKKKPVKGGPLEETFEVEVLPGKNDPIDYDVKADAAKP